MTRNFPVLSAGVTPRTPVDTWTFAPEMEDGTQIASWAWQEFRERFMLRITLTRDVAPGWSGARRRINLPAVQALLKELGGAAESFVCGPDEFVGTAAGLLLEAGQSSHAIRTERFGPGR